MLYQDRVEAGRVLAKELRKNRRNLAPNVLVLGLPRGGVPVAYEVARALDAPLDVCVVRKIGAPMEPEFAIGAVAEDGVEVVDRDTVRWLGIAEEQLEALVETGKAEVEERVIRFRHGAPKDVRGMTVILVDDGVATGATARAALLTLRARGAGRLVLAVPVGASETLQELASEADEIVCPQPRDVFMAVGLWYDDFSETTDEDVMVLLQRAENDYAASHAEAERDTIRDREARDAFARGVPVQSQQVAVPIDREVRIPLGDAELEGRLTIPPGATGLVLFAHGSGSGRHSSRNRFVAGEIQRSGLGTLLFDLLTPGEAELDEATESLRFDIDLLAERLLVATDWAGNMPETMLLSLGYFGASTGAAAALEASVRRPGVVRAIVSRGGRPDLAGPVLADVAAPTLLLVGSADTDVLELNQRALNELGCEKAMHVVTGATHLFEQPGALEEVARSAVQWFKQHLGRGRLRAGARA
ncbi:phosphoribosyltransferase family protein [Labilithrix luteola]|uniref:phosphoribosyltransferase family protein n=1 Tax=Labilithrix luteola TaxID=1391654 RepID=UPI0011BAD588